MTKVQYIESLESLGVIHHIQADLIFVDNGVTVDAGILKELYLLRYHLVK